MLIVNVLIIGYTPDLENELACRIEEELVQKREIYLFNVLSSSAESVGASWARAHGIPVRKLDLSGLTTLPAIANKMLMEADYMFAAFGSKGQSEAEKNLIRRLVYKLKEQGKSGNLFCLEEFKL